MSDYKITIFRTISSTATPYHKSVLVALDRIKSGADAPLVNAIRMEEDKNKRNELKKGLTSFCFSGTFRQRSASGLIKHSSLICLDFDGFKDEETLLKYKAAFIKSKEKSRYTYACFISPSGKGIKVIVKIPPSEKDHKAYFKALEEFYNDEHFDKSGSDVSRVCYSSFDKDLYVNYDSEVWTEMETNEQYDYETATPVLKLKTDVGIISNLQRWFDKKFYMVEGERNANLFKLAAAMSEFGIPESEAERYLVSKYRTKSFTEREILQTIRSAYKNKSKFATKFFEDKQSLEFLERQIKSGVEKKKIYKKLADEGKHTEDEVDNAIKNISDSVPISEFWSYDEKGKCKIEPDRFKEFLEQNGFYKLYPEGSDNFVFIHVENNMIENVTPTKIKDFTLNYLYGLTNLHPYRVMADSPKYFKEDYLNILSPFPVKFFEDTADKAVIYFKNGAAVVTVDTLPNNTKNALGQKEADIRKIRKVELVDYLSLDAHVWKSHIIDRDYLPGEFEGCVYDRFITKIASGNLDKKLSIKSTIGYLLHSYKTSANNKAVILNDETISDNPNGGSGKGIFCNALGKMKRLSVLDGKTFDGAKSFAYQTVQADSQLLLYDDIPKNFHFETLFSVITEGITLEKKNKDAIKLPVNRSPKIIITTNYTIGGVGGSHDRRKWEIEFGSYFGAHHTPLNEFGHYFFDEWSEEEWHMFDNFMLDCLRLYLECGLIKQEHTNLAERKFIKETSFDFHEWMSENPIAIGERIHRPKYYDMFKNAYPDYAKNIWFTHRRFAMWLDIYGRYRGYKMVKGQDHDGKYVVFFSEGHTDREIKDATMDHERIEIEGQIYTNNDNLGF